MENNHIKSNSNFKYLNNGKTSQPYPIYATKIKNLQSVSKNPNNGKVFSEKFAKVVELNKTVEPNDDKQKKNNALSWILNTINPLNHIPIVSTIHKLSNHTSKSLDLVQSAIGGAIYGGGPIGLAKGVGSWLINKVIPNNQMAIKKESINNEPSKKIVNDEISHKIDTKSIKPSGTNNNEKENINTIKSFSSFKSPSYKPTSSYYFYNYSKEDERNKNKIDVDA